MSIKTADNRKQEPSMVGICHLISGQDHMAVPSTTNTSKVVLTCLVSVETLCEMMRFNQRE